MSHKSLKIKSLTDRISSKAAARYLTRRALPDAWPLETKSIADIRQVVVIPALAESERLFLTLDDLANCDAHSIAETLVICVVNNKNDAAPDIVRDNQETLARLKAYAAQDRLRLAYVDAASPGCELPPKTGVGMARKIGMDWAVAVLGGTAEGVICSLDADTRVRPDYLAAISQSFDRRQLWGASIHYEHPLDVDPETRGAITRYELFLRYYVLGLRFAGSPYAFHTVGSAMACRAEAYVAVSGMNKRQAGEDFYFLNELAKTGGVRPLASTTVYPSPRASQRVPFGTGARITRYLAQPEEGFASYHPASFDVLRQWLKAMQEGPDSSGGKMLAEAKAIALPLWDYLTSQKFEDAWDRMRANARDEASFAAQTHRWFDAFRTLKCIHCLRDAKYGELDLCAAVQDILEHSTIPKPQGRPSTREQHDTLLTELRRLDLEAALPS